MVDNSNMFINSMTLSRIMLNAMSNESKTET